MSPRAMTRYNSGIVTIDVSRFGPCVDCGAEVTRNRSFTGADATDQRERWKAEPLRCRPCARERMRAQAGVE